MKQYKLLFLAVALPLLVACNTDDEPSVPDAAFEISGITATVGHIQSLTRATSETSTLGVGRTAFANGDTIVFTTIKRTSNPLTKFTYSNIRYSYDGSAWSRCSNGTDSDPEKIYWSDVTSAHTFTGYCLPHKDYYWHADTINKIVTYQSELGYGVGANDTIDFSAGNDSIIVEDLLVSHSKQVKADTGGASAEVDFTHALSNVCMVVNVKGFATNALDKKVNVSDMVILNQPCVFTWGADTTVLSTLDVDKNKKKHIKLWRKSVSGENENKTFVFYGLTTPQDATYRKINGNNDKLSFKFSVTYPNALDTAKTVTHTYKGSVNDSVFFNSGKCTTINVTLNHRDEKMQIDVNYNDWNYVATPDLGKLRKKSTYMTMSTSDVTIHSKVGLTAEDATWLYTDGGEVYDVYGNDGNSATNAYRITSAAQLLSFAKEVNSDNGVDFTNKYIRLDADITMQKSSTASDYSWIGIGDADHAFNGTFLGGDRYINRLKGNPLFVKLDSAAVVEQLYINTIGDFTNGVLAGTNNGVIGGCKVIDDVEATGGVLVGTNNNTVYACYYTGDTDKDAGIVGTSSTNQAVGCYMAGNYSLYEMQQSSFIKTLNDALDELYKTNTNLTKFHFTHNAASYPTVTK